MKMEKIEAISSGHARHLKLRAGRVDNLRNWLVETWPDPAAITLEIGCGHGHYLTAYAGQHREAPCIGIDLVTKRIAKAKQKRDKRSLGNLHFLKAEVREFLDAWPPHLSMERVFVLFPDPWPKKRHTKNRILQTSFLDALSSHAGSGTPLHFRTDHEGAFAWGVEVIAAHPRWEIRDDVPWPFENPSFFQDLLGSGQSLTAVHLP